MKIKRIVGTFVLVLPFCCMSSVCAGDGWESVRCGSDVSKALVGRKVPNEPVVDLEERHKDIQLKDLGAEEITEQLNLIFWLICGEEYAVLENGDVVKDVLKSKSLQRVSPICKHVVSIKRPRASGHSPWSAQERRRRDYAASAEGVEDRREAEKVCRSSHGRTSLRS